MSGGARRFTIMATLFLATACDPSEIAAPITDKTADDDPARPYTADLRTALAARKSIMMTDTSSFGGMSCSPATPRGNVSATRGLTLTLPERESDRVHVLAVVTPGRGVLEIYSPYDDDTEAGDLIVPSQAISWAKARGQRSFATSTDALDGLRPGSDTPEALFIEPGRYRFVLANGIDAALQKANGTAPAALAGCSFDWQP